MPTHVRLFVNLARMKILKIVFGFGVRVSDVWKNETKLQFYWFKFLRWTGNGVKIAFVLGLVYGAFQIGAKTTEPRTVYAEKKVEIVNDSLQAKIADLKQGVLVDLRGCETKGFKESDGVIILDTNNKMSIGPYQFQKDTVVYYEKSLYNKVVTPKDSVEIALDQDQAGALASDVIFNTDKGLTNWINCSNSLNLVNRVAFIKDLEK